MSLIIITAIAATYLGFGLLRLVQSSYLRFAFDTAIGLFFAASVVATATHGPPVINVEQTDLVIDPVVSLAPIRFKRRVKLQDVLEVKVVSPRWGRLSPTSVGTYVALKVRRRLGVWRLVGDTIYLRVDERDRARLVTELASRIHSS